MHTLPRKISSVFIYLEINLLHVADARFLATYRDGTYLNQCDEIALRIPRLIDEGILLQHFSYHSLSISKAAAYLPIPYKRSPRSTLALK